MASPLDARLAGLARAEQQHLSRLAARAGTTLDALFLTLRSVDDAAAAAWLDLAVPAVEALRRTAVSMAYAYGAMLAGLAASRVGDLPEPGDVAAGLRGGVDVAEVYARPIGAARHALAQGLDFATAMRSGAARAAATGRTDVAVAWRAGDAESRDATRGCTGYTRIAGPGACHYCLLIATGSYSRDHIAPAHANCTCAEAPVIGRYDPGAATRADALSALDLGADEAERELEAMPTVAAEAGPSTP